MTNREEVAKKLRENSTVHTTDEAYVVLLNCMGITYDYANLFNRLADLIDPTCHMSCKYGSGDDETDEYMEEIAFTPEDTVACHCHTCDTVFRYDRGIIPNYCPNCSARVVRDEA